MGRLRTNLIFTAVAIAAVLLSSAVLWGYLSTAPSASTMRLGFFPNVTHAQALYGIATGMYQRAFGDEFAIQPLTFNAGPDAIQALLSNRIDVIFMGPSPTLNGLALAGPEYLKVIAGTASGGAFFVVQPHLDFTSDENFGGKKFATPQYGNTQDIALKHYLLTRGHRTIEEGGDVEVINAANANILTSFQLGQVDGAWVPEPWATRLLLEANAKVLVDERTLWPDGRFVTTHLVTTKTYLEKHQDILGKFLAAYVNVTLRLQQGTSSDLAIVNDQIWNVTGLRLSSETITAAFMNFDMTYDPIGSSLATYLTWAQDLGFIPPETSANSLYDLSLLKGILEDMGLPPVAGL